jgi:hypothetical protein
MLFLRAIFVKNRHSMACATFLLVPPYYGETWAPRATVPRSANFLKFHLRFFGGISGT